MPMRSMFGGLRAAGRTPESRDPRTQDYMDATRLYEWAGRPRDPSTGVNIDAIHRRYKESKLHSATPVKPPAVIRPPGRGYTTLRDYIDAAKNLERRYP